MVKTRTLTNIYLGLIVLYVGLTFYAPIPAETLSKYRISELQTRFLILSLVIPIIAIWLATLYGFLKFRQYSTLIKASKDGQGFSNIATGLGIYAFTSPILAVMNTGFDYFGRQDADYIRVSTILNNYVSVAAALLTFYFIYKGSVCLTNILKKRKSQAIVPRPYYLLFAALGVIYIYLTLNNPSRHVAAEAGQRATFYLPDWLIVASIIIPYLFVWFFGMKGFIHLRHYYANVSGILYKKMLRLLTYGFGFVILTSIVLQYLTALNSLFTDLALQPLLAIIYVLIILIGAGYILIALGAKQLKKIEEV